MSSNVESSISCIMFPVAARHGVQTGCLRLHSSPRSRSHWTQRPDCEDDGISIQQVQRRWGNGYTATVQQIMTGLKMAERGNDSLSIITKGVYSTVMRKYGPCSVACAAHFAHREKLPHKTAHVSLYVKRCQEPKQGSVTRRHGLSEETDHNAAIATGTATMVHSSTLKMEVKGSSKTSVHIC
jgi:hypothetical protein